MEVVLTSNLVSLETKNATTACNFQHDFMPWEANRKLFIYINMKPFMKVIS